jgi:hypothetical protein
VVLVFGAAGYQFHKGRQIAKMQAHFAEADDAASLREVMEKEA